MKCYNHHDRDAFAVCSTCGKGLCLECAEGICGKMECKSDSCRIKVRFSKNILIIILLLTALCTILLLVD